MSTTESIYISAQQVADRIGLSKRRVNQLVADGELVAVVIGNANAIQLNSVKRYEEKRRPRKSSSATRRYCSESHGGCGVEITETDERNGVCTQCGKEIK